MIYRWSVSGQIGHIPLIAKQSLITFWRKKIMGFAQSGARLCRPAAGISLQKLSTAHAKSRPSHWSRPRHRWPLISRATEHVHLSCPGTKLVPDKPSKLSHTFRCRRLQIMGLLIGQLRANLSSHWSLDSDKRKSLEDAFDHNNSSHIPISGSVLSLLDKKLPSQLRVFEFSKWFDHLIKG